MQKKKNTEIEKKYRNWKKKYRNRKKKKKIKTHHQQPEQTKI